MIRTLAADHRPSDATHRSDASIGLLREWDRRTVRRVDWRHLYWSLSLLLLFSCADQDDLSDGSMELPAILRELSGMVAMDDRTIACVQDEVGSVFLVDLLGQHACRQIRFGLPGDYEGIALQDGVIWILQSKGVLGQLAWQGESLSVHRSFKMSLEAEFEGLCYDAAHQRLLVLPKGPMKGQKRERRRRRVFAFDLQSLTMVDEPVMTILVEDLEEQIAERKLPAPRRTTRKGKRKVDLHLDGSELLALPSGDLLLLSPKDHLLLRFDSDGGLVATQALDPELLPQPESIALLPDGRLLVGTEGVDADAIIKVIPLPQ